MQTKVTFHFDRTAFLVCRVHFMKYGHVRGVCACLKASLKSFMQITMVSASLVGYIGRCRYIVVDVQNED